MAKRVLARRGLDRRTHRQLTRYENLLLILGIVSLATALAVGAAWLLGVVLNGAISA